MASPNVHSKDLQWFYFGSRVIIVFYDNTLYIIHFEHLKVVIILEIKITSDPVGVSHASKK